jgi:hypothetical protein
MNFLPWQKNPMIRAALKERHPRDIAIVWCDQCGSPAYYNEGSHCSCQSCEASLDHKLDADDGEVLTLDDVMEAEATNLDDPLP